MIKFFRKIRQKLVQENRVSKYLIYALGEIILVVIGILIALQINNWNETRKSKKMANEIYTNLLTSLEQDSVEVERTITLLTKSLETQRKLILYQSNPYSNLTNPEDLDNMVQDVFSGVMSFFPKTGVYDLITSNNSMELLQSKKVKSLLINLYDFQYKRYENVDLIIDNKYHYHLGSLIRKKIGFVVEYDSESQIKVVKSVNPVFFNNYYDEFVSECQDVYSALSTANNYLLEIKKSINELIVLIKEELNNA